MLCRVQLLAGRQSGGRRGRVFAGWEHTQPQMVEQGCKGVREQNGCKDRKRGRERVRMRERLSGRHLCFWSYRQSNGQKGREEVLRGLWTSCCCSQQIFCCCLLWTQGTDGCSYTPAPSCFCKDLSWTYSTVSYFFTVGLYRDTDQDKSRMWHCVHPFMSICLWI